MKIVDSNKRETKGVNKCIDRDTNHWRKIAFAVQFITLLIHNVIKETKCYITKLAIHTIHDQTALFNDIIGCCCRNQMKNNK